ncbi:hypothetical protein [Cupriavidus campinensis]
MRKIRHLFTLLTLCLMNAHASDDLPPGIAKSADGRTKVAASPYYQNPASAMKYLVAKEGKNLQRNRFCAVGYNMHKGYPMTWVLWEEERTLILWRGSSDADVRTGGLWMARRNLKLGRDTVATENDINGSTYITTVDWWISVADDCRKHGEQYEIEPFKIKPSKPDRQP